MLTVIGTCKTEAQFNRHIKKQPSATAGGLLDWAMGNRNSFFEKYAFKLLERTKKELALRDDGRKKLDIFNQAYDHFSEKYSSQRECPLCGHEIGEDAVLPPRP